MSEFRPHVILLVEDDEVIREATAESLRRDGFEVRMAGTGPDGLAAFREREPSLAILDLACAASNWSEPALRDAIGATDPAEAAAGTVRKLYAESKGRNAIHASDSDENAAREARFFFAECDWIKGA